MTELALMDISYNDDRITLSGRELHDFLDVETPYHKWFPRMLKYNFVENMDYRVTDKNVHNSGGGPQTIIDHEITIDMAKELCMLQRTDKGKQARQYFIQLEKEWNSPEKVMARGLIAAHKELEQSKIRISELEAENTAKAERLAIAEPKAEFYDDFVNPEACTSIRVTAKEIGVGERTMVKLLLNEGLCYRGTSPSRALLPYNNKNKGYFIVRDVPAKRSYNMVYQTRFTPKGKQMMRELCRKHGLLEGGDADTNLNNASKVSRAG